MKFLKKHYYWIIAAIVLIQQMVSGGINNNLPSLFLVPVTQSLGISRGAFSLAYSLKGISAMISTGLSGGILLRYGYRKSVAVSLLISVAGLLILSLSQGGLAIALGHILYGLSDGICIHAGCTRILSSWFHKRKGTMLGLATAGTGIGGSLVCILLSDIIQNSGWRNAYLSSLALIAAVFVVLFLLVKDRPEDMGLQPYGYGSRETVKTTAVKDWWAGFSMKEIVRKPLFYMMCAGTFLSCVCATMVLNVLVAHLQDRGLQASDAVAMQSVLLLLLALFKFAFGAASDRFGVRPVMMICLSAGVTSLIMFSLLSSPWLAWVAIIVYAAALPVTTVMIPLLSATLFGYRAQISYVGIFFAMVSAAGIVTAPITNFIYDRIGSYSPVFLTASAISVFLMILYPIMYKMSDASRNKLINEQ